MSYDEIFNKISIEKIFEIGSKLFQFQELGDVNRDTLNTFLHNTLKDIPDVSPEVIIKKLEEDNAISFEPNLKLDLNKIIQLFGKYN